jgi:hypothetical protein
MSDDFYIGYHDRAPGGIRRRIRLLSAFLLLMALLLSALLVRSQNPPGDGSYEFGVVREYSGFMTSGTVPLLISIDKDDPRPRSYLLVSEGKHGFSAIKEPQFISLMATLIQRDGIAMLEVVSGTIEKSDTTLSLPVYPVSFQGMKTVSGEIVDSKCFLGVMKPGDKTVHRACARLCISGGIPPMLIVKTEEGKLQYALLTGPNGEAVHKRVLPFVALPVRVTGTLLSYGMLNELRVSEGSIRVIHTGDSIVSAGF